MCIIHHGDFFDSCFNDDFISTTSFSQLFCIQSDAVIRTPSMPCLCLESLITAVSSSDMNMYTESLDFPNGNKL